MFNPFKKNTTTQKINLWSVSLYICHDCESAIEANEAFLQEYMGGFITLCTPCTGTQLQFAVQAPY